MSSYLVQCFYSRTVYERIRLPLFNQMWRRISLTYILPLFRPYVTQEAILENVFFAFLLEVKLPYEPVFLSVGWMVGRSACRSVCHSLQKGPGVTFHFHAPCGALVKSIGNQQS